jgi:hypothetical protein
MTTVIRFSRIDGGPVLSKWGDENRIIGNLGDLRLLLEQYSEFEIESVEQLGVVAGLLAVRALTRAGHIPSRSNIMRTLDQYDFVLPDERYHQAFQHGLEETVEMARADIRHFEAKAWKRLN